MHKICQFVENIDSRYEGDAIFKLHFKDGSIIDSCVVTANYDCLDLFYGDKDGRDDKNIEASDVKQVFAYYNHSLVGSIKA